MDYKAGLYNIVRTYIPSSNKANKLIKKCVSLDVALKHCNSNQSNKDGEYYDFFQKV